jgi:heat shock protein HslJ
MKRSSNLLVLSLTTTLLLILLAGCGLSLPAASAPAAMLQATPAATPEPPATVTTTVTTTVAVTPTVNTGVNTRVAATPTVTTTVTLTETVWQWTEFQDTAELNDITVDDPAQYTLTLLADGTVAIQADCNRAAGTYTLDGSSLTIEIGPVTLAACPPESLSDVFLTRLPETATYVMDDEGQLFLNLVADAGNMVFQAKEPVTIVGAYHTLLPSADSPGRFIALTFFSDNSLTLISDFLNGEPPVEEVGTWGVGPGDTYTLTLTGQLDKPYDEPVTIVFQADETRLDAVEFDKERFGEDGLRLHEQALDAASFKAQRSLLTVDFQAGHPLDPFFVSVNGGGGIDVGSLSDKCTGFVSGNPVVTVDWEGEVDMAKIFFFSDHDPTLIIRRPDGTYVCNDDAHGLLLDPVIDLENPQKGTYHIWVGSAARDQLIPGVLVLTTRPDVNLGTFDLSKLIQRELVPETVEPVRERIPLTQVTESLTRLKAAPVTLSAGAEFEPVEITAAGTVPAFEIPADDAQCNGFIGETPDYTFAWTGATGELRIFFEGDADTTLLVVGPNGTVWCADDVLTGENSNPLLAISDPVEGNYAVFVGRLNSENPVTGRLTVTDAADAEPVVLEPEQ